MGDGLGRASLLLPALATLTRADKAVVWWPTADEQLYPPTLQQAGMDLSRVLFANSRNHQQRLWGAEQCLRSGACGAVVFTEVRVIPDLVLRRLKLAAATSGAIGFVLRNEAAAKQPSPASLRLRVRAIPLAPPRLQITVLKCAGHSPQSTTLDLDIHGCQP